MSPAFEVVIRVLMAVFWVAVILVTCVLVVAFWMLVDNQPSHRRAAKVPQPRARPRSTPRQREQIADAIAQQYAAGEDLGDVNDYKTRHRGCAPPSRGGPRILGRKPSQTLVALQGLDASARAALESVLRGGHAS